MSINRVRDERGPIDHHVIVLADLSAIPSHARHLNREVYFDALTELPNLPLTQLVESIQHSEHRRLPLAICSLILSLQLRSPWPPDRRYVIISIRAAHQSSAVW